MQGTVLNRSVSRKKRFERVAGVTGLEPATSGVTGRRSNQLSYTPNLKSFYTFREGRAGLAMLDAPCQGIKTGEFP